jgi:hypothetical protein
MRIDYDRLILLLLPIRLRTVRLVSLLTVLIAPIVILHDNFHAFAEKRRLRAAATPQALMLERLVLSETGLSVKILPVESGASPDFEVKHPDNASAADVAAAESVIDRYKLAGKSYRVVGSVVPFTNDWSDFICTVASIAAIESVDWTDMVCKVITENKPVNMIRISQQGTLFKLISGQPVTSDVSVTVRFNLTEGSADFTPKILTGQYETTITTLNNVQSYLFISTPIPASDDYFEYITNE